MNEGFDRFSHLLKSGEQYTRDDFDKFSQEPIGGRWVLPLNYRLDQIAELIPRAWNDRVGSYGLSVPNYCCSQDKKDELIAGDDEYLIEQELFTIERLVTDKCDYNKHFPKKFLFWSDQKILDYLKQEQQTKE